MGILTDEMKQAVNKRRLGYVATVCPDGTPNLSPKGTTRVWDEEHVVFADIRSPATVDNIRHNPGVEINVVDPDAHKGYRFKGTARVLTDGTLFENILNFYKQEGVTHPIRSIVLVKVDRAQSLP